MHPREAWELRKQQYSVMRRRVLVALQSHLGIRDKALMILALFDKSVERHMVFNPFLYERMLDVLRLASHPDVQPGVQAARYRPAGSSAPVAAEQCAFTDGAWSICEFMFQTSVTLSPDAAENIMTILAKVDGPNPELERRAHEVVLHLDTRQVVPTKVMLAEYFKICKNNGCMHIAVARYADAKLRHEITPDPQMATNIIVGLVYNNQVAQALKFISTLSGIAVDRPLINACVDAARRASDPLYAFDMWTVVASPMSAVVDEYTVTALLSAVASHRSQLNGPEFADFANIAAAPRGAGARVAKMRFVTKELVRARLRLNERTSLRLALMIHAAIFDVAQLALHRAERGDITAAAAFPDSARALHKTATVLLKKLSAPGVNGRRPKAVFIWRWAMKIDAIAPLVGLARLDGVASPPPHRAKGGTKSSNTEESAVAGATTSSSSKPTERQPLQTTVDAQPIAPDHVAPPAAAAETVVEVKDAPLSHPSDEPGTPSPSSTP